MNPSGSLLALIFLLCLNTLLRGTDIPFAIADPQPKGEWTRLAIPLKRSGNLMLLEVTIDSIKGDFILDTGAPYPVLNKTYFRNYIAKNQVSSSAVGVSGKSNIIAEEVEVNLLKFSDVTYDKVRCDVVNLRQLENSKKTRILGLLGTSLFSELLVRVNVRTNTLYLYRIDDKGQPLDSRYALDIASDSCQTNAGMEVPFKWCDNKVFMNVKIAGKEMNWMFDTGAESNVVDAMSQKKVIKEFVITKRVNVAGAAGSGNEVFMGFFEEITVGEKKFIQQQTLLTGMSEMNEACSMFVDGILGYSFFSSGVFELNFKKRIFSLYFYDV